jgi:FkbM family methyltransferase
MLININYLVSTFQLNIKGILHVGAHECEELSDYNKIGIPNDKIYWIEALEEKVQLMKNKDKTIHIYQAVIDETDNNDVVFKITNNTQCCSILEFGSVETNYPSIKVIERIPLRTSRLDTLIMKHNIPIKNLNFLNLDIQGVELRAIKSMEKYLCHIDYIYTEVNTEEVYKNCDLLKEIDIYLESFGFKRVIQNICSKVGWGDVLYIKNTF